MIDYATINNIAEEILSAHNIVVPPVPVKKIIEAAGIDIIFGKFKPEWNMVSGITDFKNKKIYVNAADHSNRQHFTMAHEFGHWILHQDKFKENPEQYNYLLRTPTGKTNDDPLEKEANAFAAFLLVPAYLLRKMKPAADSIEQLARFFMVSEIVIEHRLKYVK